MFVSGGQLPLPAGLVRSAILVSVMNCETNLLVTFGGKLDAVVWNHLVDLAVFIALTLGMPHQDDQL